MSKYYCSIPSIYFVICTSDKDIFGTSFVNGSLKAHLVKHTRHKRPQARAGLDWLLWGHFTVTHNQLCLSGHHGN